MWINTLPPHHSPDPLRLWIWSSVFSRGPLDASSSPAGTTPTTQHTEHISYTAAHTTRDVPFLWECALMRLSGLRSVGVTEQQSTNHQRDVQLWKCVPNDQSLSPIVSIQNALTILSTIDFFLVKKDKCEFICNAAVQGHRSIHGTPVSESVQQPAQSVWYQNIAS